MNNGAKGIGTAFIALFLLFFCACYQSSGPVVPDVSLEETEQESPAEVDGEGDDPVSDDPEIIDDESDIPSVCPEGLRSCGGICADILTDPLHCGGCDDICPDRPNAFPVCVDGECGIECELGYSDMNGDPLDGCEPWDVGRPEECNGMDDDMDGRIDEDFECIAEMSLHCTNACGTDGLQVCSAVDCTWGPCCSSEELCGNACDDDCDGLVDESCP